MGICEVQTACLTLVPSTASNEKEPEGQLAGYLIMRVFVVVVVVLVVLRAIELAGKRAQPTKGGMFEHEKDR